METKKSELSKIYKRVDVEKFLKHYKAVISSRSGPWLRMCCILPGHKDSSPSANFNTVNGVYNCFVCGGKSFFKLVQELESFKNFASSIEFVKKMIGYEDEYSQVDLLLEDLRSLQVEDDEQLETPSFVSINLSEFPEFEDAKIHFPIVKHRVSFKMIDFWKLKYAISGYYKDRLIVPITHDNECVSFVARDMSGRADRWLRLLSRAKKDRLTVTEIAELVEKYECKKMLYPPVFEESSSTFKNIIYGTHIKYLMFNIDRALKNKDYVILVEGVFDAMRLYMWGFNVVALLGTKLSIFNRKTLLSNFDKIYVSLDNDIKENKSNPGQDAAAKIIDSFGSEVDIYNIVLPPGVDPDECSREQFNLLMKEAEINAI